MTFERMATPMRDLATFYRTAAQARVQRYMISTWVATRVPDLSAGKTSDAVSA
jgi:hypothetical protein